MPDYYTHAYVAQQALMRSGKVVASHPAFLAGANGPDPFFYYKIWSKKKSPDLPALGKRMHREKMGVFLATLVQLAMTSVQQSYALGFLSHYAADCIMHPYIEAMSTGGGPYDRHRGRDWMQAAVDSDLYFRDYKTRLVPLHAGTPVLITEDLAQVTSLLHDTVLKVYGVDVPPVALADTFHDNLSAHQFLVSKHGGKKLLARILEPILYGKKGRDKLLSHMQPAKPLAKLPENWKNPYTQEELNLHLEELLVLAQQGAATYIMAAMDFWLGLIDTEQFSSVVGDNNYYTGLPNGKVDLTGTFA